LERNYNILKLSREREEKSKLKIENLQNEINHLNQLIEKGNAEVNGSTVSV